LWGNWTPGLYKTLPITTQIACKKTKQHSHKQQTTPTHKIKVWETKNLQQFVELQKLVHKSPNLPHQIETKGQLVNWIGIIEKYIFLV